MATQKKKIPEVPKKKMELKLNFNLKKLLIWGLILMLFLPFVVSLFDPTAFLEEISISQAISDVKQEKVEEIKLQGDKLVLNYGDDEVKVSRKEEGVSMVEILQREEVDPAKVNIEVGSQALGETVTALLVNILPIVGFGAILYFMMRQSKGAQSGLFGFGKSKAKLFSKGKQDVTFDDVAGVDEAKNEMEEVVDFLKNPKKYKKVGARTPKGVLLIGPSGVGKTLLARAVAGQADVPFFSMAGSEFMEMLVGVGASVVGQTPVLIRDDQGVRLVEIGDFVDDFYEGDDEGFAVSVRGVKTLGLLPEKNKFWGSKSNIRPVFGGSAWRGVEKVYRHKVDKIFRIRYLGGELKTTGDHSVFVREQGGIRVKEVRKLKKGDVLVDLPANTRAWNKKKRVTEHLIKKHQFRKLKEKVFLDVWQDDEEEWEKYEYAREHTGDMSQVEIAEEIGVSQMTVSNWQRGKHVPQSVSKKLVKLDLPDKVKMSVELCKLFGYYTAEGRGKPYLEFVFGKKEDKYIDEVVGLMKKVFGMEVSRLEESKSNTVKVKYHSAHLGRFFAEYCGEGSSNKHIPEFLWDLPKKYYLAYLEGYSNGDGYVTKAGKLSCTSVSQRLIRELAWLSAMHGIKTGIKHEIVKEGRVINGKPLPETECWKLIIGKTSNPFGDKGENPYQFKKSVVREVVEEEFEGYVYDLCGVEQEAFFGGEKPVLLHNSRVRDLFETAKKAGPSIIFIDELDAIGRKRGVGSMGGHDEREQTLNQILVEMDGFTPNDQVVIIGATNRPDVLDPALVRPGRFDRRISLDLPDIEGRKDILKIHARGKPFDDDVDWEVVAKRTVGFSGADLENMLNEAAILAARRGKSEIDMDDISEAALRVKLGPEKRRLQSDYERKLTAYHEGGHAVVGHMLPGADPVHRVSIVSRMRSLGQTLAMPDRDKYQQTKEELVDQLAMVMGGRAAENLVFDEMTVGAASDIEKATKLARKMVVDWGMTELGPIALGPMWESTDWGRSYMEPVQISEKMKGEVDKEIKKLVDAALEKAEKVLKSNREKLDKLVDVLLERETVELDEFREIMGVDKAKKEYE